MKKNTLSIISAAILTLFITTHIPAQENDDSIREQIEDLNSQIADLESQRDELMEELDNLHTFELEHQDHELTIEIKDVEVEDGLLHLFTTMSLAEDNTIPVTFNGIITPIRLSAAFDSATNTYPLANIQDEETESLNGYEPYSKVAGLGYRPGATLDVYFTYELPEDTGEFYLGYTVEEEGESTTDEFRMEIE